MFSLTSSHRYYLYSAATDMRSGFDSLSGIVRNKLERDPVGGEVFVFINRRRNQVKLLHWERGGFVLYYKRLERGNFELPVKTENGTIEWGQLVMMIEGISVENIRMRKRYYVPKSA